MSVPDFPRGPAEGRDTSGGTSVDPADAAAETAHTTELMDAAENYAARLALGGYAGSGPVPGENMVMTGADDVPGA